MESSPDAMLPIDTGDANLLPISDKTTLDNNDLMENGSGTNSSALSVPTQISDSDEWGAIINRLVEELNKEDLPDKVVEAAELLLAGYPTYQVARKVNVTPKTVRRWLSTYPTLAAILTNGKKLLTRWRMGKLEQQFLVALERSEEVLNVGLDGTYIDAFGEGQRANPKIIGIVAAQARYIIGLFAGQKQDITVTHELGDSVLKAKQDALAYLAEQLAQQQARSDVEPIEAVYRVIDAKADDAGPMLDEQGRPPFGEMGLIDRTEDGLLCHVCGKRLHDLSRHILTQHNCGTEDYETLYMLPEGAVRQADGDD